MENVQGELSAHVITVSEFSGKKIACTIECIGHDPQNLGIVNTPAADQWGHFVLPPWPNRIPVMLKRWRNAQRRPARRPGVYSDRISLDASNLADKFEIFLPKNW